jgi:hypothetical protein
MKKLLFAGALAAAMTGPALAQNTAKPDGTTTGQAGGYAFCLKNSAGPGDCKYQTMAQCQAAMSGTNSECVRNVGPR